MMNARSCRLLASAVGALLLTTSVHAQSPADATVTRLLGPTISAFVARLETSRPPPVSATLKARILEALPEEGEVTWLGRSERHKLASLQAVLRVHDRDSIYTIKVVEAAQAAVGLHARSVVLISQRALRLLNADELRAVVAHEIGHEYVWDEYHAAWARRDARRLQELELFCDGVAIVTLRLAGLDPGALAPGLAKITRFNRQHLGVATNEAHYPSLAARHRFIEAVIAWSDPDPAVLAAWLATVQDGPGTTTRNPARSRIDIAAISTQVRSSPRIPATPFFTLPGLVALPATAQEIDTEVTVVDEPWPGQQMGSSQAPAQGPPANLKGGAFQPLIERMWRDSPTFRRQCARLARVPELRITVRADLQQARSGARAYTTMARSHGRLTSADVVLLVPVETVELIAHEIEHIIEQLDGVEPQRDSCARSRSTSRAYESCRALEMGRRVAREVEEAERTRVVSVRQRDQFSAPLDPATASVSPSGRFVAFISMARLLPTSHTGRHLYVLDLETGLLTLESARTGWPGPSTAASTPRISADGSVLVVDVPTWEGTPTEQFCRMIVVVHRPTGTVRVPEVEAEDVSPCRHNHTAAVSADGRTVVFESIREPRASGERAVADIYLMRLDSGDIEQVNVPSRDHTGAHDPARAGHSMTPAVSADGRYVAFTSTLDLTCGATSGCVRHAGGRKVVTNIYVRDTVAGVTTRVTRSWKDGDPNGPSSWPAISADGRYVAFTSDASNLVKGDRNQQADVFVHDRLTGTIELVSRRPDGQPGNAESRFPAISGDGYTVAFQSLASDLICTRRCTEDERDINLLWDVFAFDRRTGTMTRASADGTGEWIASSRRPSLDHTGRVLVFSSRHPIDEHDVGHDDDLYIRVRGEP